MGREDWYRRTTWTQRDQDDFFLRLERSRSSPAQFLRIQASYLQQTGRPEYLEAAVDLLNKLFSEYPDSFEFAQAYVQKAECLGALGRIAEAEQAYRASFEAMRKEPSVRANTALSFGIFVIRHGLTHLYEDVVDLLKEFLDEPTLLFPIQRYTYFAIIALISAHWGLRDEARAFANRAIEASQQTHSGFRYHPKLGLVERKDPGLHRKLEELAQMPTGSKNSLSSNGGKGNEEESG